MKPVRTTVSAALAAFTLSVAFAPSAFAQDPMATQPLHNMANPRARPTVRKAIPLYVCTVCKKGYTEMQAKSIAMKDPMGHPLTKVAKLPKGFTMAPLTGKMLENKMKSMRPGG